MRKRVKDLLLALAAVVLYALFVWVVSDGEEPRQVEVSEPSPERVSEPSLAAIPSDLIYEVVSEDTFQDERRSLDVRLSHPVDESVLEALAWELKGRDSRSFNRTYIVYYLPGMPVDEGGWATSHFRPDLVVRILGIEAGAESRLSALRSEYGDDLLGAWENNQVGSASTFVLIQSPQGFSIIQIYPDGSARRIPVNEIATAAGRRFEDPKNRFGEFYLLREGRFELHDTEGLVFTALPLSD